MSILAFTEHFNMVPRGCFSKPDNHFLFFRNKGRGFKARSLPFRCRNNNENDCIVQRAGWETHPRTSSVDLIGHDSLDIEVISSQ